MRVGCPVIGRGIRCNRQLAEHLPWSQSDDWQDPIQPDSESCRQTMASWLFFLRSLTFSLSLQTWAGRRRWWTCAKLPIRPCRSSSPAPPSCPASSPCAPAPRTSRPASSGPRCGARRARAGPSGNSRCSSPRTTWSRWRRPSRGRVTLPGYQDNRYNATLALTGLRSSDSGMYRCEVVVGLNDEQDTVPLEVTGERRDRCFASQVTPRMHSTCCGCCTGHTLHYIILQAFGRRSYPEWHRTKCRVHVQNHGQDPRGKGQFHMTIRIRTWTLKFNLMRQTKVAIKLSSQKQNSSTKTSIYSTYGGTTTNILQSQMYSQILHQHIVMLQVNSIA